MHGRTLVDPRGWAAALAIPALLLFAGCPGEDGTSSATLEAPTTWEAENPVKPLPEIPLGLGDHVDFAKLKFEVTPEKVRLGRLLFFDGRLSKDGTVSCATCHRPENAFSEPTPVSTGVGEQKGTRKSPTFINGAFPVFDVYFWDGRAASLQEQAKGPIENPIEMATTHDEVVKTLVGLEGYRKMFTDVYGDSGINIDNVADAIAAYEATRLSGDSAWDLYKAGDESAMSDKARHGERLFFGAAGCSRCHIGFNFTDSQFHNLGVGWDEEKKEFKDIGRYEVTKQEKDKGAFKTPTLRDVSRHAPFMHDGSQATLTDVVQHYNEGGTDNPTLSPIMKQLGMLDLDDEQVEALVEFMKALDGEGFEDTAPTLFP